MVRERLDLTGLWRCQPAPYEEGEEAGYYAAEYDVRRWRETQVPGSFDQCAPGMASYEGPCWYRRRFEVPQSWRHKRVIVRFEAVNYHARVWVNGRPVGEHPDGFLRFELPVHEQLRYGAQNVIAVRADNTRRKGEVPGMERGWRPYGGILREVELIATDPLHISDARITAEPNEEGGVVSLEARLVNERADPVEARLAVEVADGDGQQLAPGASAAALSPGQEAEVRLVVPVEGAEPWSPSSAALYLARVRLWVGDKVIDGLDIRFGFRRIEARDGKLFLNGERVFLTGFNRHEDSPRAGMCTDLGTARRDLMEMKKTGANFVRLCHYPHHPRELDLCDELGLLVMAEIPLYFWNGSAEGEENCTRKLEAAKRQLANMIGRDRNHPSIVFWSVSNESREQRPEVAAGNAELVRLAQDLDSTRLAVHVSDRWGAHPHFECDDVICVNGYPTWSGGMAGPRGRFAESIRFWAEGLAGLHEQYPDKPILVTEFGYPCLEDVFGGTMGEDLQARAIEAESQGMTAPYVCGVTLWCWADHPWPEEPFIRYLTTSPFGVVTRRRRRLQGYGAVKRIFTQRQGLPTEDVAATETPAGGHPVNMVRPHLDDIPQVEFPPGFSIRPMKPDETALWTDIQRDAEPHFTPGDELFYQEFGSDLPATTWRCFFIVNDRGVAVATISAWYTRDFKGQDYGRIHWVATRPACRRRGLAKAGMSYALNRLAEWHERAWLGTSTARIPAIKMYLDFGFLPDLEPPGAANAWRQVRQTLKHPVLDQLKL